jgi:hypothetical protein
MKTGEVFDFSHSFVPLEGAVDNKQPSPGEWAMMGGAAVALLGSFLDVDFETSAWGSGMFPIATIIAIYCSVAGILVGLQRFANVNLPTRVAGMTWNQIYLALGFFATLMSLFWLFGAEDAGAGLFLILLGSAAVMVGAFITQQRSAGAGSIG